MAALADGSSSFAQKQQKQQKQQSRKLQLVDKVGFNDLLSDLKPGGVYILTPK